MQFVWWCECSAYVETGDVLSVQGPVDRQLSRDRVDEEDPHRGLVCSRASHTVAQGAVFIVVRPDLLADERQCVKSHFNHVWGHRLN